MATFDDILNEIAPATYEKVGHQRLDGRAMVLITLRHSTRRPECQGTAESQLLLVRLWPPIKFAFLPIPFQD
jgi:hypothetical protein